LEKEGIMSKAKKAIWGWALYDWANSAFATTVMAGFVPLFFKGYWSAGADVNTSTAQLGLANSLASLFIALIAPILGSITDKANTKKAFLIFFAYLGVLSTAALYLVNQGDWGMAIFVYVMGNIGFAGANIFYDSLLPSVADDSEADRVSSLGFALGYLGGGILFLVNVLMYLKPELFGLADGVMGIRVSFITVGIWWGLFTIFTIRWVKEREFTETGLTWQSFKEGLNQYLITFRKIRHLKPIMLFLLAYWFYIDGVDTIIKMAVDYGMSLGFESADLIIALLIVQFVGFPFALLFGWLGTKWDTRKAIYVALGMYIFITIWGVMMKQKMEFYFLAILIATSQGGIQALSRSYYMRIIPKSQAGEFFGFYNMLGKFAAILGPLMIGVVGLIARNALLPGATTPEEIEVVGQTAARWGIGSIVLLFLIGGTLFYFVDENKGREEAKLLEQNVSS